MDKPNILFIMTDQQSADAMSCAANPHLRTPALDRLAARGIRFDAAYSSYPLCVPARMSIFTGRMPHELGIYVNCGEVDQPCGAPMLAARLRDAGYRCHYVGKWHLTVPEKNRDEHGFEQIELGGGYGGLDSAKADAAVKFLGQKQEQPFFLTVSFNNPHDCCELSRGNELRMGELPPPPEDPDQLPPLPENWRTPEEPVPALRQFQREYPKIGCALEWDELQTRRYRWGYNRLVEMVDAEIGRVLAALEANGLWEDTLIVFASDHGDGQGAHGWNQKWCMYDEVSRVPLIVKPPGAGKSDAGAQCPQPVSATLDIFPTLCDYAGAETPKPQRGHSLRALFADDGEGGEDGDGERDFVASESSFGTWAPVHEDRGWPKARMVRSRCYKYIAYNTEEKPREQLFDMQSDPQETINLAADTKHAKKLEYHRQLLRDWLRQTNDSFRL